MAGNMQYMQDGIAKSDGITLIEYVSGFYRVYVTVEIDAENRQPGAHCGYPRHIQVIGQCLHAVSFLNEQISEYMVKMQMCIEQMLDCQAFVTDECRQLLGLTGIIAAGIDYNSLAGLIPYNVCVDREEVELKALDTDHICT
jgi:hypothetical protein